MKSSERNKILLFIVSLSLIISILIVVYNEIANVSQSEVKENMITLHKDDIYDYHFHELGFNRGHSKNYAKFKYDPVTGDKLPNAYAWDDIVSKHMVLDMYANVDNLEDEINKVIIDTENSKTKKSK